MCHNRSHHSRPMPKPLKRKSVTVKVTVSVKDDYDLVNDGIGGLSDIIKDGLKNPKYSYLDNISVKQEHEK